MELELDSIHPAISFPDAIAYVVVTDDALPRSSSFAVVDAVIVVRVGVSVVDAVVETGVVADVLAVVVAIAVVSVGGRCGRSEIVSFREGRRLRCGKRRIGVVGVVGVAVCARQVKTSGVGVAV